MCVYVRELRESVCKPLWMCVILGGRVCPGLCMWFHSRGNGRRNWWNRWKTFPSTCMSSYSYQNSFACSEKCVCTRTWGGVCVIMCYYVHTKVFQWACLRVLKSWFWQCLPCVSLPPLPCVSECICWRDIPTFLPFHREVETKSWRGGVVNTGTLSAEQPVCIILCGKQLRQTRDF